jgi:hypothetical protein
MAMEQARRLKKLFFGFIGIMVLVGLLLVIVLFAVGEFRLFYDAKVTRLLLCHGGDPSTGLPMESAVSFPADTDQLYACGYLETSSPVRLGFLLFFENQYVRTFVADRKFDQGYFVESLCLDKDERLKPGLYRVDIYLYRNKLGSTEFFVTAGEP